MSAITQPIALRATSRMAREAALPVLKKRAIEGGFITTVCMDCFAYVGDKPGAGVSGISHGLCEKCEQQRIEDDAS